jgi:acetyltransferase-like isoleucine patch superfamily enzyme
LNDIPKLTGHLQKFIVKSLLSCFIANDSAIAQKLRSIFYGTGCLIDTNVFITNNDNFSAGTDTVLYHGSYILNNHGKFSMGNNSHLGAYCYVNVCHGRVTIGDDVAVGPGTQIIAYSNHYTAGKMVTDLRITDEVVIGNNVFIGTNCSILPGTVIEDNVIVGAGSVAKGLLKTNSIYAGVPCRIIKEGWYC